MTEEGWSDETMRRKDEKKRRAKEMDSKDKSKEKSRKV